MTLRTLIPAGDPTRPRKRDRGFTLAELLIAITVFIILSGGIIAAHLYGLSMFRITETKFNATAGARQTLGQIAEEVRTCKSSWVGNIRDGVFEALLDGEAQQGSGLLIHPTSNTTEFIIYFVNPSDQTFRRTTSLSNTVTVLAESITNAMVFCAQDYLGNVLTNNQNNQVIHLNLEFYQPTYFRQASDVYKLETSVTRRAL